MQRTPEGFGSAIVAVGSFNPAIFSPDWLEKHNLLGADDAAVARENASIALTSQFTRFDVEWATVQVLQNQFSITSKGPLTPAIVDLAKGAFSILPHTPIQAIGLNFYGHYAMSEDEFYRIGDVLAPKEIWKRVFPQQDMTAGLGDLTIKIQHTPTGRTPVDMDEKRIRLQPSDRIRFGVLFSYNSHYQMTESKLNGRPSAEVAAGIVAEDWQRCWDDSVRVFDAVIESTVMAERTTT